MNSGANVPFTRPINPRAQNVPIVPAAEPRGENPRLKTIDALKSNINHVTVKTGYGATTLDGAGDLIIINLGVKDHS